MVEFLSNLKVAPTIAAIHLTPESTTVPKESDTKQLCDSLQQLQLLKETKRKSSKKRYDIKKISQNACGVSVTEEQSICSPRPPQEALIEEIKKVKSERDQIEKKNQNLQ